MKPEEKRKLLKKAFKAEFVPFLADLEFRPNRNSYAARPIDGPFGNTFWRERGEYTDELQFSWGRPPWAVFGIHFWTDQTERMIEPDRSKLSEWYRNSQQYYCSVLVEPDRHNSWLRRLFWVPHSSRLSFGQGMSIEEAIALAKTRVLEVDHHLKVAAPTPCIRLVGDVVVKRGDPSDARPAPPAPAS